MALFGSFGQAARLGLAAPSFGQGIFAAGRAITGSALAARPAVQAPVAGGPVVGVAAARPLLPAGGALVGAAGSAIMRLVFPVLQKVANTLGRRTMSLRAAIRIIRRMGKFITDPTVIATSLGITVAELAQLITASSHLPRRRMNPANVHALRRSLRRIESFHHLCTRADILRTRRRARAAPPCPPTRRR